MRLSCTRNVVMKIGSFLFAHAGILPKMLRNQNKDLKKDNIFFAIEGTKFDGNKYIFDAINNGAMNFVMWDVDILKKTADVKYFELGSIEQQWVGEGWKNV